jgi:asparagine synthase (glutamine-hydrolysing)
VKGLLPALGSRPTINLQALDQLFTFWAPVSPETVFQGVEELGPGEMLVVDPGGIQRRTYWDWRFPEGGDERTDSDEKLAAELLELLRDATRIRLRSDVPVGAYLSGGLDSSAIAALVRSFEDVALRTFSIAFEDASLDESGHQERMVSHLGAEHSVVRARNGDIAANFLRTIRHTEAPVLRTAPVPMGILSGLVRSEGFKVVLTGEGSDEVLGGYDLFKEAKIRRFWAANPDSDFRASLLGRLYPYLDLGQSRSRAYLRRFFGQALETPDIPFFSHLPRWTTTSRIKDFFSSEVRGALSEQVEDTLLERLPEAFSRWHPFNRAQYLEARTLMAGYLLCSQGDRMLMSSSVEGRFPFLDHRVMEFANSLHPKHKMRGLREKALLKRAMRPFLPGRDRGPPQAAVPGTGHRRLLSGGRSSGLRPGPAQPRFPQRGRAVRPGSGRAPAEEDRGGQGHRCEGQHGLRRHPLHPGLAPHLRGKRGRHHLTPPRHPMEHTQRIRAFILDTFLFTDDPSALEDDDSFLDKGIIDSTGVLELVMFLEDELGIEVDDEELVPENLDSVERVSAFVRRKLG